MRTILCSAAKTVKRIGRTNKGCAQILETLINKKGVNGYKISAAVRKSNIGLSTQSIYLHRNGDCICQPQ